MLGTGGEGGGEGGAAAELEAVDAVLHGDAANAFSVKLGAIGGGIVNGDTDRLGAGDNIAVDVSEKTLVVDERGNGSVDENGAEQEGGDEDGFHEKGGEWVELSGAVHGDDDLVEAEELAFGHGDEAAEGVAVSDHFLVQRPAAEVGGALDAVFAAR